MTELKGFKGLQGLDLLLAESRVAPQRVVQENVYQLAVDQLCPLRYQPRTGFDDAALAELVASIQSQGIIVPLIVRDLESTQNERYAIIAGERRWRAAKIAGLQHVPAMIRCVSDETAFAFAIIENIQRESLNPVDEALAFARLQNDFKLTHEEISSRVGRSRSSVSNMLRLLSLHEDVKNLLKARKLEMGHARAILGLSQDTQLSMATAIVEKSLSVRETEKQIQAIKLPKKLNQKMHPIDKKSESFSAMLSKLLCTKVKVNLNEQGQGKVTICIASLEKLERLIQALQSGEISTLRA